MKKIAIVLDSSADISNDEAKNLNVTVIRMPLTVGTKEYLENDEITDEEFFKQMNNNVEVKTSQPLLGDVLKCWNDLLKTHDEVLCLPLSSPLSGTYSSAVAASADFKGRVTVVDTRCACYPMQILTKDVQQLIQDGLSCVEIKNKIEGLDEIMYASIIPESLTHLKNGGRVSPAVAVLGNLLKIIPVLKLEKGAIDISQKVRTTRKAYRVGLDEVINIDESKMDDYHWFVVHSEMEEEALEYKKMMEDEIKRPVHFHVIRSIISAHTGPRTLCFARLKKLK